MAYDLPSQKSSESKLSAETHMFQLFNVTKIAPNDIYVFVKLGSIRTLTLFLVDLGLVVDRLVVVIVVVSREGAGLVARHLGPDGRGGQEADAEDVAEHSLVFLEV